jgi:hypothetical protein
MELLGDVAHVKSCFDLFHDGVSVGRRCTIGLENNFGRTRWYSKLTRLKWKLISDYLETVLILTHCAERTIGPMVL